jgi:hypothetical protein
MSPNDLFRLCVKRCDTAPPWPEWDNYPFTGHDYVRRYPTYGKAWRFAILMDERLCMREVVSAGRRQLSASAER